MPITRDDLEAELRKTFPDAKIAINALAGDNDHWSLEIQDASFKNLSRIAQHKAVQAAVAAHDIHALQIKTVIKSS